MVVIPSIAENTTIDFSTAKVHIFFYKITFNAD